MTGRQLDLFSGTSIPSPKATQQPEAPWKPPPCELGDADLIAVIPGAGLADGSALAKEAGRRRLAAAVPALERLCRRFTGFGSEQVIPEQAAALQALTMIGGPQAAAAVARIISKHAVEGPAVRIALSAAVNLESELPNDVVLSLLCHADRSVRAVACRCVRFWPEVVPVLVELLDELDGDVVMAAACALGRLRRPEAKKTLLHLLRTAPSAEVIDAVATVADADCVVLLARIARHKPDLAASARAALEQVDHPLAAQVLASLRNPDARFPGVDEQKKAELAARAALEKE